MSGATLEESENGIRVHIPMSFRKRSGRKEIVVPDGIQPDERSAADYHDALVIAISRAHRWKKLLDEGKYRSIAQMSRALKINRYYLARLLRLTLFAPAIIETVLESSGPDGLSIERLRRPVPTLWSEQTDLLASVWTPRSAGVSAGGPNTDLSP